jgi:hypothetical protein
VSALLVLCARPCLAASEARIEGGVVLFYADSLTIVVRNGVRLRLDDGALAAGDAAFIDLRTDRAVIAGDARITRGTTTLHADALALRLLGRQIAALDTATGITPAGADASAFTFPDLDDKRAYIRARRAQIVARTSARFEPAFFPTSTGAPPVPMYLYTFAAGNGYAATALSSAAFDQPYGLLSSPSALTALHLRYLDGIGPSLGLEENLIDTNNGFVAGAIDAPFRVRVADGLNAYRQIGAAGSVSAGGLVNDGYQQTQIGFTQAIGTLVGRLNYGLTNGGYSSALLSLRTRDRALFDGITWHTSVSYGFQARNGGLLTDLPDRSLYSTVWQHGIDLFFASPLIRGPLRTTLSATVDGSRTDYAYPHHNNALETNITGSRRLNRALILFFGYDARWSADIFPNDQSLFYPPSATTYGFTGYQTARLANLDLQYVPGPYTSVRVSYRRADDFPQVNFFAGRPPNEVRADLRLRPFPNIGVSFGRSYDFGWNGSRFVPGWSLSVFQ